MNDLNSPKLDERTPNELIEEIIFPFLLKLINRAKRDYNIAASQYEMGSSRLYLMENYAKKICDEGGVLSDITGEVKAAMDSLSPDVLWNHPLLRKILEDKNSITLLWLELLEKWFCPQRYEFQRRVQERLAAETDVYRRIRGRA